MKFVLQKVQLVGLPCVSSVSLVIVLGSRRFEKSAPTIVDHRKTGRFVTIFPTW